jgi:RNA polymerase sigma-70 factor, ECF subfamily
LSTHQSKTSEPIKLQEGSPEFDEVYLTYFNALHRYAFTFVRDEIIAEEMVHQVFWRILEKPKGIQVHTSLRAYLYRAVYYECLNYLKHQQVKQAYELQHNNDYSHPSENPYAQLQYKELEGKVKEAINDLPEQCRTIFQLSRFENLKYAEIAGQLNLSIKTVETQMSRALKKLRIRLADYLPMLLMLVIKLFNT